MKEVFLERKIKILIMDTPIGSGHVMAAKALKEEFYRQMPEAEILHIGTFDFLPRILAQSFVKLYLLSLKISPKIYAFFYRWGNKDQSTASRDRLNFLLSRLARSKILDFAPDIAVATHATAAGIIAQLKSQQQLSRCSLYGVVTDYIMHSWWYYSEVSAYFTANIPLDNIAFAKEQKVYKYGIPLRAEFREVIGYSREQVRMQLQLSVDSRLYLLFGGGEGILPMQEIVETIKSVQPEASIIAICGRNSKLCAKINALNIGGVQALGFVHNVAEYIYSADCVISKAGGISSTEILTQNASYIVYKPLMGQEMNNALFLKKQFAIQIINNSQELAENIQLKPEYKLDRGSLVPVNSTEKIVRQIFDLTSKHNYEYNANNY